MEVKYFNNLKNIKIKIFQKSGFVGGAEVNLHRWVKYFQDQFGIDFSFCGPGEGLFFDWLKKDGYECSYSSLPDWRKGKNFFSRYLAQVNLLKIFKNKKIDLIFSNDFFYAPYAVYLGQKLGVPVVIHVQSDCDEKRISQYQLNRADGVIVTTESTYLKLAGKLNEALLVKIPCGVEKPTLNSFVKKKIKKSSNTVFGIASNVLPHKGIDFFISLIELLKESENWEIIWVGGDPQGKVDSLKEKVSSLGLSDRVTFLGFREDMDDFYSSIDCLIHPAQFEPFGIVLIEAMSHGLPVISTNTSGGWEILGDIDAGQWLVPLDGWKEMGEKMIQLIQKTYQEREQIGYFFYEKYKNQYTLEVSMNKMEHFFSRIIEKRSKGILSKLT